MERVADSKTIAAAQTAPLILDKGGLSVEIRRICVDPWFQTVL